LVLWEGPFVAWGTMPSPSLVNIFLRERYFRLVGGGIWLAITLVLIAVSAVIWRAHLTNSLQTEVQHTLGSLEKLHGNVMSAFAELRKSATSEPCSPQFIRELQRVAFVPDGLNEFIYAPGGRVTCSTSLRERAAAPEWLGLPDVAGIAHGEMSMWIGKRLDAIGRPDMYGHIVYQEPFAIVVPLQLLAARDIEGTQQQFVISSSSVHHLAGKRGLYRASVAGPGSLSDIRKVACGTNHPYCFAMVDNLPGHLTAMPEIVALVIALLGFYAIAPAAYVRRLIEDYWSFEARFLRTLDSNSVVCSYQPILDIRTGKISGCEVLARWRDLDGSVVSPDTFIDIVAKSGRTLDFTKMIADRAYHELSTALGADTRLQVNFNIFPRDLDCQKLSEVFNAFERDRDRFTVAIEITESDSLDVNHAQAEIETLARKGIRTYVDDFGNGYSNLHRIATLAVHGVKLDRSFAMAPDDSMMARMMVLAIDMMASSGREIVVEGVETQERLDLLAGTNRVAYAQGYLISRPLAIDAFADFLARHQAAAEPAMQAA
jgi:sensor c-di-GMP phosphodiesterase-like protein